MSDGAGWLRDPLGTVIGQEDRTGEDARMADDFVHDVEARVALMRRLGIRRLDIGGWEVELGPAPEVEAPEAAADVAALFKGPPEGDDALFWSTAGPLPSEIRDAEKPPEE